MGDRGPRIRDSNLSVDTTIDGLRSIGSRAVERPGSSDSNVRPTKKPHSLAVQGSVAGDEL